MTTLLMWFIYLTVIPFILFMIILISDRIRYGAWCTEEPKDYHESSPSQIKSDPEAPVK